MNNKGQTLVLFVVVLPILLLVLVLVIDIGKIIVKKLELDNISEIVLEYGIGKLGEENIYDDMFNLVKQNNNDIDKINIDIREDKIYLSLSCDGEFIFKKIIDSNRFKIESNYVGYFIDGEKRIERVGD